MARLEQTDAWTVFAPNSAAFAALDAKLLVQLRDPRNLEVVEKVALYHVIEGESVELERILKCSGLKTEGGEVSVSASKSGGFMGVGGKEDGGVLVNGGKIVSSARVGGGVVHEVDCLINPFLLYRFLDAVRMPGQ
ncbi:hypothetical protein B484DRAFT_321932 [Ochromonadaceae sp. CCMP2298]|nr:hypothetical protein B484DRAFT_321932 [Ochromonadaceae sp. CCMP2298]